MISSTQRSLGHTFARDYAETQGFQLGRPVSPIIAPDGKAVYFLRAIGPRNSRQGIFEFNLADRVTREVITVENVLGSSGNRIRSEETNRDQHEFSGASGFLSFQLSKSGKTLLAQLGARLLLIDCASAAFRELPIAGTPVNPRFSPDGSLLAFVKNFDLWIFDTATNLEQPLTRDGCEAISHGSAEFVAREEMGRLDGYWWAPDSKSLLYQESDAREVEVLHIADPFVPQRPPERRFYPRPGKANVKVRLGVISVKGGRTRWLKWDSSKYPYVTHVDWHIRGRLTICVQTRDQREIVLLLADPESGYTVPLLTENDPAWLNLDQRFPQWLKDGSGFLWSTERNGGWELELRNSNGEFRNTLVAKQVAWHSFVYLNESENVIYFLAQPTPVERQLCRRNADGSIIVLTRDLGVTSAVMGGNPLLAVITRETPASLARSWVQLMNGAIVGELPSVADTPKLTLNTELLEVNAGEVFHVRITRPSDFNPAMKYPVLIDVYGGPRAQIVQAAQRGWLLAQWLADQGFIVVASDNRGTPGRGRHWERSIAGRLGRLPIEDQVAALRGVGARLSELDLDRVGIMGWSFGGYVSALATLIRPDIFKAGVAGAPVVDWLDYDSHYTERYLGMPRDKAPVYAANSLINHANRLSRPLLLLHGTADDNVLFSHALKLADALTRAGNNYEFVPLCGFSHMVPEPAASEQAAEFFRRHLGGPCLVGKARLVQASPAMQ